MKCQSSETSTNHFEHLAAQSRKERRGPSTPHIWVHFARPLCGHTINCSSPPRRNDRFRADHRDKYYDCKNKWPTSLSETNKRTSSVVWNFVWMSYCYRRRRRCVTNEMQTHFERLTEATRLTLNSNLAGVGRYTSSNVTSTAVVVHQTKGYRTLARQRRF